MDDEDNFAQRLGAYLMRVGRAGGVCPTCGAPGGTPHLQGYPCTENGESVSKNSTKFAEDEAVHTYRCDIESVGGRSLLGTVRLSVTSPSQARSIVTGGSDFVGHVDGRSLDDVLYNATELARDHKRLESEQSFTLDV
jgi:hypothetical protein